MLSSIEQNTIIIKEKINSVAQKFHKNSKNIDVVAVSKYHNTEQIKKAYNSGFTNFGENYIQEWKEKNEKLSNNLPNLKWHIIGNIQKNKVKFLNSNIFCLQSLDRIELAKEIEKKAPLDSKLNVFVQLVIDKNDSTKSGAFFEDAKYLCDFVANSKKMSLSGFMGIGPAHIEDTKRKTLYHEFTSNAFYLWNEFSYQRDITSPVISLGMSSDFEIAIECGSTMLRIGTAIFGERNI